MIVRSSNWKNTIRRLKVQKNNFSMIIQLEWELFKDSFLQFKIILTSEICPFFYVFRFCWIVEIAFDEKKYSYELWLIWNVLKQNKQFSFDYLNNNLKWFRLRNETGSYCCFDLIWKIHCFLLPARDFIYSNVINCFTTRWVNFFCGVE